MIFIVISYHRHDLTQYDLLFTILIDFLISDYTKMKGKMNVAILESFVNFYKNHSKIISLYATAYVYLLFFYDKEESGI